MLSMLVDTMIPETFEETQTLAGLVTVFGFLCAFTLSKLDEASDAAADHASRAPSSFVQRAQMHAHEGAAGSGLL